LGDGGLEEGILSPVDSSYCDGFVIEASFVSGDTPIMGSRKRRNNITNEEKLNRLANPLSSAREENVSPIEERPKEDREQAYPEKSWNHLDIKRTSGRANE